MPPPVTALDALLHDSRHLWRGREMPSVPAISTGFASLDARLPGAGWPRGTLIEIVPMCEGLGELRLLMPVLRNADRSILFIAAPHTPYAPALVRAGLRMASLVWIEPPSDQDARWCAEQALREGMTGAVLLWSATSDHRSLRRLQLAAEVGQTFNFLYRRPEALAHPSPAAIRLAIRRGGEATVSVELVKVRGATPARVTVPLPSGT